MERVVLRRERVVDLGLVSMFMRNLNLGIFGLVSVFGCLRRLNAISHRNVYPERERYANQNGSMPSV